MTQVGEAIVRYHKILEQDPALSSSWMKQLREEMAARRLVVNSRPVTPVLRPHFLSRRQYSSLVKTAEALNSAIERVRRIALDQPQILARMDLLPAEKMLAAVDPGYSATPVLSLLETRVDNGSIRLAEGQSDLAYGIIYGEMLAGLFYDSAPVKEFRKKYKLSHVGGTKLLASSILKAWKEFGGKRLPRVGILEFKQPFASFESHESELLVELLARQKITAAVVSPDQLDYRNGVLRHGGFELDLVYRGLKAHEFLLRYDLTHPLVRAYRDRRVCVVNSFRSEMTRKKSLLALLTDDNLTSKFPAIEKKAIHDSVPWTRVVSQTKVDWNGQSADLPELILKNRARFVLRPNEDTTELPSFEGARIDDHQWERALKQALRDSYVVQEGPTTARPIQFPVDFYGDMVYRELDVEVTPQSFLGKIQGLAARITPVQSGFSSIAGLAPVLLIEGSK